MSSPFPRTDADEPLPPLPPPGVTAAGPRPLKNPWVALVLSFLFPGVGQIYNGQPAKALVFFFAFVGSIYGAVNIDPLPFAFLIPFTIFYNLVDAWRSATIINARALGGEPLVEEDLTFESPYWGVGLLAGGLLLLMNNLGLLRLAAMRQWWPLLLVVAGALLLNASLKRRRAAQPPPAAVDRTAFEHHEENRPQG